MPIVMKYGSPGPILAAGYAAGVGHQMHAQQDDALKVWQQQNQQQFQAGQSWLDRLQQQNLQQGYFNQQNQQAAASREFQANQQNNALGFQSTQAGRQRDFQAAQTDRLLTARAGESALDAERRVAEAQRHEQFLREQNTELGLRRGELTLPPAAQAQLQKLEADKVEAMKLDPAKQAEFMGKYTEQKRGLYGMALPSNQVPYDERLRSSLGSNYEQYKDLPWQFNEQGERSLPSGFKMPGDLAGEQQNKFNDSVMKQYEKNLKEVDENNKPLYGGDENKALQAAIDSQNQIERGRQRLVARGNTPANTPANPVTAAPPEPTLDPEMVRSYNTMQDMKAMGATSWTYNPNTGGEMNITGSSYLDRFKAGNAHRLTSPKVPMPGAAQAAPQVAGPQQSAPPASSAPAADFDSQWSKLKPGESLRGPDGKLYTKRNK